MKPLRDLVGRELKWTQPRAMKREFELMDDGETVAQLHFRSSFGSFATAESAGESWTFKRVGFWQTRVTICPAGTDGEIASFRNNTWNAGGTLELADGRQFRANTNFWGSAYEFRNEAEEPLVRFRKVGGVLHLSSMVEILPAAAALPELPWMVALGWYLAVKMHDDASGVAAAAAAG
jgi:hypothetical protein